MTRNRLAVFAGLMAAVFAVSLPAGCLQVSRRARSDKFWLEAKQEVDRDTMEILAQRRAEIKKKLKYRIFMQGSPSKRRIALTFDDGPHPSYTPKLLSILKRYGVKATFFLVGEMAEKYPDLVMAEAAAGHGIANHTYDHVNLKKIPTEEAAVEIEACGEVIESITGKRPHLFRPPGGDYDREIAVIAESLGYTMVLWTANAGDWSSPGKKIIEGKVLNRISPGGIILMHDGIRQTTEILPQILGVLKREGYEFVTVEELMAKSRAGI